MEIVSLGTTQLTESLQLNIASATSSNPIAYQKKKKSSNPIENMQSE